MAATAPLREGEAWDVSCFIVAALAPTLSPSPGFFGASATIVASFFIGDGSTPPFEPPLGFSVAMFGFEDLASRSGAESFDSFIKIAFATSVNDLPIWVYSLFLSYL